VGWLVSEKAATCWPILVVSRLQTRGLEEWTSEAIGKSPSEQLKLDNHDVLPPGLAIPRKL
jgi:hypothetical protein